MVHPPKLNRDCKDLGISDATRPGLKDGKIVKQGWFLSVRKAGQEAHNLMWSR